MALGAARAAALAGRARGSSGTSLPGKVLLRLDPQAIGKLARGIPGGVNVVSSTNGKTTTCALAASCLRAGGMVPVHNHAGANMAGGIASALLSDGDLTSSGRIGLFEVDEFWLPEVAAALEPTNILISNVFRDQLDRYGELDTIIDRWNASLPSIVGGGTKLLLCADDPGVASLADAVPDGSVTWFGIDDPSTAIPELPHSSDSSKCRRCGTSLEYDIVILGHLGHWRCQRCGNRRPSPDVRLTSAVLDGATGSDLIIEDPEGTHRVRIGLPGIYNAYNALAAWVLSRAAGVAPLPASEGLTAAQPAFGRAERFDLNGSHIGLLLVKNPTGANEVIRTLDAIDGSLNLVIILNDRIADGRDVSWIWDADFEVLADSVESVVCAGTRGSEMALRLAYAGWEESSILVVPDSMAALEHAATSNRGDVWVLPTYTAMTELRKQLESKGLVPAI